MDKIIKINIIVSIILISMIIFTILYYIRKIYKLHKDLNYYNDSELACNKDPIELETVRYNMDIILADEINIKKYVYSTSIIVIVSSSLMLMLCSVFKLYDFVFIYILLITLSSLIINCYTSNDYSKNQDVANYRKLKKDFIKDLQLYLNKNNIKTIVDLPSQLYKSLIARYKVLYDINNVENEYSATLNNEYEIVQKIKSDLEKVDDNNNNYIDVNELFKYLKLYYDTSNPKYSSDLEYITKRTLNRDIFEIINEYYWDNEKLLDIMSKKYITIESKIALLKPYLVDEYKNSIYIYMNDNNEKESRSVSGYEKYYDYMVSLIIKNDILLNKNIENIILSKYLYDNNVKKILENNYNKISDKLKDLRKYLKAQYKEAIDEKTGEATEFKRNTYSYIKQVVLSNDKLIGDNDMSSFYNLAYGKHNPYGSLKRTFTKILIQLWIYIIIILYLIFHFIYKNNEDIRSRIVHFICITTLLLLMLIMILPITWTV